jgi:REP element-mobilizing transposase RayT
MSTGYKINDQEGAYYLTLQVVGWIDVFTRQEYKDIIIESLRFCQKNKGLTIFAYVIMSNHVHLLVQSVNANLSNTIRDFKSFNSKVIIDKIESSNESRKEWMLEYFKDAAQKHERNSQYQFWTHEPRRAQRS